VIGGVRSRDELTRAVEAAEAAGAMVVHTLVEAELRRELARTADERRLIAVDAMGPMLEAIATMLGVEPVGVPGRYRRIREDYFQRIEAIEFAVHHDDGRNCGELHQADVVLIGVSRSGKTPLSMYLAMRGYKSANVPLVEGLEPPDQLFTIDRRRVVGLTLDPERLVAYRRQRQQDLGVGASTAYSDPRLIVRDLEFANRIMKRGRFATIDVTVRPVEESAGEVIALISTVV
jgi:hypothetical protein